jgi:hypothetical protein
MDLYTKPVYHSFTMTTNRDQTVQEVLRAVLLRSELIPPTQVDPLISEILTALHAADLKIESTRQPRDQSTSTAQLDMLDRWGHPE